MNETLMTWMDEGNARIAEAKREALRQITAEKCKMERLMKAHHIHTVCLVSAGACVGVLMAGAAVKRRMNRAALAKEIKKQLDPVNEKLEALKAQNEELKRQNQALLDRLEPAEAPGEPAPETPEA